MPQHYSTFSFRDFSNEISTVTVFNGAITAVSLPGFLTDFAALQTALQNLSLGQLAKTSWVGDNTTVSALAAASEYAQRELKWRVKYRGNTSNKVYQIEIPCADVVGKVIPGTDQAYIDADMTAFITAFETIARTPDSDAETVTVLSINLVGRNI